MQSLISKVAGVLAVAMVAGLSSSAHAVGVSITPSSTLTGFMNWTDPRPGYNGASGWGVPDLRANFTGNILKLEAAPINDANDYWYVGGGGPGVAGAKTMDANAYVEDSTTLGGQTVTFTGTVLQNSLVSPYTAVAFIKDFAPDYSSNVTVTVPLTPGNFSVSLNTLATAGRHVQYGYEVVGPNVWPTDVGSKGFVTVQAIVPEPVSISALGAAGLLLGRRRRA